MSDLETRLRVVLGGAYRIDRELSGGGMSRVFVATEYALDRQVVIAPPTGRSRRGKYWARSRE
jgi:ABC-type glutathione transport system ATPase component